MPAFVKTVLINAPVDDVFRFHEWGDDLSLLSPAFRRVRIISGTAGIDKSARGELRVGFSRWFALHTVCDWNWPFDDPQIHGPFAKWVHRHKIEAAGCKPQPTDRIEYELRGDSLVTTALVWTVSLGIGKMFAHRRCMTKEVYEEHSVGEAL